MEPPASFLVIRQAPALQGDKVEDYIKFGLDCKATLDKKNQDTTSILDWISTFKTSP